MRSVHIALAFVAAIFSAVIIYGLSSSYFQSEELSKAKGRLSLYRSTVIAELERFSHLTYVLARDPFVIETSMGGDTQALNVRLAAFAEQSGLDAIYLMRPDGVTIAASNADQPSSFVGHDYSFRPYLQDAAEGRPGRFYGIGSTTGLPGYFIADPVFDAQKQVIGVIAIKLALSELEESWSASGEQVVLANADGVVLLSSNSDWRYRVLEDLSQEQRQRIRDARQFADQPLDPWDWEPLSAQRAVIDGDNRIHLTSQSLPHDWQLHYFADDTPAVSRSWLATGLVMILSAAIFIYSQFRRTQRIGEALRRSEAEEAELRLANDRLAIEIEDRKTAERRLQRTQGELERASRLAALGQLSASVTHELGQPITAMRNHLAVAEMNGDTAPTMITRIAGLVDRMEGITRQLKFFARSKGDAFGEVDLGEAMRASLALVEPNIAEQEVELEVSIPQLPVLVRGNQLRLEQVMTNILRNAVDAVEDTEDRRLWVSVDQGASIGWFEVHDSGHGLGKATMQDLQEPFVTTRESGRGMGLGLAISATIIKEHQGRINAHNREGGGAVFRVELPSSEPEDQQV